MYEGMNKGDKLLTNENRCIQFCDETPGCNSFTLCDTPMVPMFKNCHLKDRLLNGSETSQYKKSCTTYYRFCGKIPCHITFKLVQGYISVTTMYVHTTTLVFSHSIVMALSSTTSTTSVTKEAAPSVLSKNQYI